MVGDDNLYDPEFNSGITYLQRLNTLFNVAHINATNDHDYDDWYMVLNQIFIEIIPRLNEEEEKKLEKLKVAAASKQYMCVWRYHRLLNVKAHKLGLFMRDKENAPGVIKSRKG